MPNDSGGLVAQLFLVKYPQRLRARLINCDVDENTAPAQFLPFIEQARKLKQTLACDSTPPRCLPLEKGRLGRFRMRIHCLVDVALGRCCFPSEAHRDSPGISGPLVLFEKIGRILGVRGIASNLAPSVHTELSECRVGKSRDCSRTLLARRQAFPPLDQLFEGLDGLLLV